MNTEQDAIRIPLQVGSALRIGKDGTITIDNPEVELAQTGGADAVLSYRFNAATGEHILHLLDPLANHQHISSHHRDD